MYGHVSRRLRSEASWATCRALVRTLPLSFVLCFSFVCDQLAIVSQLTWDTSGMTNLSRIPAVVNHLLSAELVEEVQTTPWSDRSHFQENLLLNTRLSQTMVSGQKSGWAISSQAIHFSFTPFNTCHQSDQQKYSNPSFSISHQSLYLQSSR